MKIFIDLYNNANWILPPLVSVIVALISICGAYKVAQFSFHQWRTERLLERWSRREDGFLQKLQIFSDFIFRTESLLSRFDLDPSSVSPEEFLYKNESYLTDSGITQHPVFFEVFHEPESSKIIFSFFREINNRSLSIHRLLWRYAKLRDLDVNEEDAQVKEESLDALKMNRMLQRDDFSEMVARLTLFINLVDRTFQLRAQSIIAGHPFHLPKDTSDFIKSSFSI